MKIRNESLFIILGILIVLILGWGVWRVVGVLEQGFLQFHRAVSPLQGLTENIGTQVANLAHPTPTILPDPITIIHSIRSLARLETIQYSVEKIITAESGQGPFGFLFGDRLLLVAHGIVIAGVDLDKLQPEDLRVENGVLLVHLPKAEIFIATLDNEKTYVYNRETGLLTHGNITLESDARRAAEDEIRLAAISDGILDLAQKNAEAYLIRLFGQLGFQEVIFK